MSKISTGSLELDSFLNGGYERDVITTLYGPAGSGKTNLCMVAAVDVAKKGKKVVFIDTEGGFSVDRFKQLTTDDVLENILLLKATNFSEQQEMFNKLLDEVNEDLGLIVVDSIVMLYRLELSLAKQNENDRSVLGINRSMSRQLRILNEIARKKLVPVIITDQVYAEFIKKEDFEKGMEKKVNMVGGDLLKYWSKCIIELKAEGSKRKAILRKHRSISEKEFSFYINNQGISKAGFRLF
ncbi:DNA repair and recombination protein RadB [Nanoarchaeota archaeon]